MQAALFDAPAPAKLPTPKITVRRTPLDAARARADLGMERAVAHADRVAPTWSERALEALRRFVRVRETPFLIEEARTAIVIEAPTDGRAWGAVTQAAVRKNYIAATDRFGPAASSNGSPKMLYVRGACA